MAYIFIWICPGNYLEFSRWFNQYSLSINCFLSCQRQKVNSSLCCFKTVFAYHAHISPGLVLRGPRQNSFHFHFVFVNLNTGSCETQNIFTSTKLSILHSFWHQWEVWLNCSLICKAVLSKINKSDLIIYY